MVYAPDNDRNPYAKKYISYRSDRSKSRDTHIGMQNKVQSQAHDQHASHYQKHHTSISKTAKSLLDKAKSGRLCFRNIGNFPKLDVGAGVHESKFKDIFMAFCPLDFNNLRIFLFIYYLEVSWNAAVASSIFFTYLFRSCLIQQINEGISLLKICVLRYGRMRVSLLEMLILYDAQAGNYEYAMLMFASDQSKIIFIKIIVNIDKIYTLLLFFYLKGY